MPKPKNDAELRVPAELRAELQRILAACRCSYPLRHHETQSGHDARCPAEAATMTLRAGGHIAGWYWISLDIDTPSELLDVRACRACGCTDDDCSQCIERSGSPCSWVEADLCSCCAELGPPERVRAKGTKRGRR